MGNLEPGTSPHEPLIGPQESDVAEELEAYWDDVGGGWLEPALVRKARQEKEFHSHGVTDIVPRKQFEKHKQREALASRKIKPIDTRWSDTNKDTEGKSEMCSRLCAREITCCRKLASRRSLATPLTSSTECHRLKQSA